jgi:hypothetical protein
MATIAISALPVATSQTGADVLPIVQAATNTTKQLSVTTLFTSPTFVTPALGTVASGNISACTSTSMVLVTPILGTPTSGNISNCTGSPTLTNLIAAGTIVSTGTTGVGYATGAGGTVVQGTSRTTGVTINKITGSITLFSAAGSVTAATFTVTNSTVAASDVIILNQRSGTDLYDLMVTAVAAGSFNITFRTTGGSTTETPVINFAIIKAVTA